MNCTQVYGEGRVTSMGGDLCVMDVPSQDMGLPTVEFDEDDKTTDQACQDLLDEQGKVQL